MKRIVFVGPSLHGTVIERRGIEFRPPARMGDIIRAVEDGFEWIGLIDGYFGSCASVWHKEILHALSQDRIVSGAASMGALRAAECRIFGMRPVGAIAWQYATGELNDDAEVALIHGPPEVDYAPFTEALVEVRCTIHAMLAAAAVTPEEAMSMLAAARRTHFSERTLDAILDGSPVSRRLDLAALYEVHRVRAKQADAMLLMQQMVAGPPGEQHVEPWRLEQSASLHSLAIVGSLHPAMDRRYG